jgi:DNA-binding SARP family transcriptional activator
VGNLAKRREDDPFDGGLQADPTMTTPPLTLTLFGPMHMLVNGQPLPRVRTRSVEWLLALLTLRQGRVVERSWLAGTLWPESEESQSLQNLRQCLLSLRQALGEEARRIQSPTRNTLTLDLEGAFDFTISQSSYQKQSEKNTS